MVLLVPINHESMNTHHFCPGRRRALLVIVVPSWGPKMHQQPSWELSGSEIPCGRVIPTCSRSSDSGNHQPRSHGDLAAMLGLKSRAPGF